MSLREIERASIIKFLTDNQHLFNGKQVLDYGSGRQPYRQLIEDAGGVYYAYDMTTFPASVTTTDFLATDAYRVDIIVCTQVIQYCRDPWSFVSHLAEWFTEEGGVLLMTGPESWPRVEPEDKWRMSARAVWHLLDEAGFSSFMVEERAHVMFENERWVIGWQARAEL
ncbi:MAG: class I SAM-dependent methyltransferase [Candidatus Krumholzibacteria bacterium]|nr:class I SAM-dependent methyltransferase [Candidatus Krumholzibacteria bacterium]